MQKPIRLLICSEAEADLYLFRRGRETGVITRVIRGRRCSVIDRCMAEWAAALQLPYCFENTWESLRQCLGELSWPEGKKLVILITSIRRILPRANVELAKMLETLLDYAQTAGQDGRPAGVEIVLHDEPRYVDNVRQRLRNGAISFAEIEE